MWWFCAYEARPSVTSGDLARRFLAAHDAGSNRQSALRGWFSFPTGTAGFAMVEVDTPKELGAILDPYGELVSWRVEALTEMNYNQVLEELRRAARRTAEADLMSGVPPQAVAGVGPR